MTELKGRICTIYKGSRRDELYLYVDKQQDLKELAEDLLASLGTLRKVMTLHITPQRKLARVDARQVLQQIDEQGYFLQMPPTLYPEAAGAMGQVRDEH